MIKFSVTRNGKPLSKDHYTLDEENRIFSTRENELVIDFTDIDDYTFKTGNNCTIIARYGCTFITNDGCTFNTGLNCTFNTGSNCTFTTGNACTFNTGSNCTFNTVSYCAFKTGERCTFNVVRHCTFYTGSHCTFNTEFNCTFYTGSNCTFKVGKNCCLIRYDTDGVTKIPHDKIIKLNSDSLKGYSIVGGVGDLIEETPWKLDGKIVEFDGQEYRLVRQ